MMDGTVMVSLAALFALVVVFAISHQARVEARLRRDSFNFSTTPPEDDPALGR